MKPIRTEEEYEKALEDIYLLFDAEEGTPEMDRLEILGLLIEAYEEIHYPIPLPDPISAIKYYMETTETSRVELAEKIGVRPNRLSELLLKRRPLSMDHIRNINKVTKISFECLMQSYELDTEAKRQRIAA